MIVTPHVGIDLGTTFSCMSYIDETGAPVVIKNSDGELTTPSVVYFDGKTAYVGKKANDRKLLAGAPIFEFVKRDIGQGISEKYKINNYPYGACGMSAIILKKLRIEAFQFFKKKELFSKETKIHEVVIPAIITVPAYFGEKERNATKMAGFASGFEVAGIINEPTAAALTYGFKFTEPKRILVFDLGGGTFDVTILDIDNGEANVITSSGANDTGGRKWDNIIESYLRREFYRVTDTMIGDEMKWEMPKLALQAKFDLSKDTQTEVTINTAGESVDITLYRDAPPDDDDDVVGVHDNKFYFSQRSQDLLGICKTVLLDSFERSGLDWPDIDEVLLAGGSCSMPMIPEMLERLSKKSITREVKGFSFHTAIAQGAAIYGRIKGSNKVREISSKTIGIELVENNITFIAHLIRKDTLLPANFSETFAADANAVLKIYEGESKIPEECTLLGRLELKNSPAGNVTVSITIDLNGIIQATVVANDIKSSLTIKQDAGDIDGDELRGKIDDIDVRP